jgi:hypothetical protein
VTAGSRALRALAPIALFLAASAVQAAVAVGAPPHPKPTPSARGVGAARRAARNQRLAPVEPDTTTPGRVFVEPPRPPDTTQEG